jgi:molecular chaperone DnaK
MPALYPDAHDANLFRTPSVVHIGPSGCLVGSNVEDLLEDEPNLAVIRFPKLQLGTQQSLFCDHLQRKWSAEAISALILRKLKQDAELFEREDLEQAVIAVPAQFNDPQRRAVRRAAELAGLAVPALVDEPVAAALYLGALGQTEKTLFVYDLGGGTFDATILRCAPAGLSVLATDGNSRCGGKWIDEALMGLLAESYQRTHGIDPRKDPVGAVQLRRLAEQGKIKLSKPGLNQVRQAAIVAGRPFEFVLTRRHLDVLIGPMIDQSLDVCDKCLASAGLRWENIDQVMLVGGSTMAAGVAERVGRRTGKAGTGLLSRQPHQAVAFGAGMMAAKLAGEAPAGPAQRLQATIASHDLGLRVRDARTGACSVNTLIRRNSPLPAKKTRVFHTSRDDQKRLVLDVVQSKGDDTAPVSLGYFVFGPIAAPRKGYAIAVAFEYTAEGMVQVSAHDPATGQSIQHTLQSGSEGGPGVSASDRALVSSVTVNG